MSFPSISIFSERSSPSTVRYAEPNTCAPLTAYSRSTNEIMDTREEVVWEATPKEWRAVCRARPEMRERRRVEVENRYRACSSLVSAYRAGISSVSTRP